MKIPLTVFCIFFNLLSSAQDNKKGSIVNVVSYEEQSILSQDAFKDVPEPYREMVSKNTKPIPNYYELSFHNNEALYKKVQKKVKASEDMDMGIIQMNHTVISFGGAIERYENYKTENRYLQE